MDEDSSLRKIFCNGTKAMGKKKALQGLHSTDSLQIQCKYK